MKKLSLLVLICMLLSVVFTACEEAEHTHAYGKDWVLDATNHYNVCTCGEKSNSAAHADADGDGACDTCKITMKHTTHAYGTDWAYDATNHYHACVCGEKSDSAAHADENNDGACDVCAIIMSNEHVFDTAWTSDATDHWHAALCDHDLVDGKAAHTANELGLCSVCGYKVSAPAVGTIAEALEIAGLTQGTVKNGLMTYGYGSSSYLSKTYTWYEYGANFLHILDVENNMNVYATLNEDGSVYYISISDDPLSPVVVDQEADETYMGGPAVDLYSFVGHSEMHYGPVAIIERLYNLEEARVEGTNFAESVEDGVYSFGYTLSTDYGYYVSKTIVNVEFTLNPDTYILESATITADNGSDYINSYVFTQTVEPINDYTPDKLLPVSYKFANAEGVEIDPTAGITFEAASSAIITFKDVEPATALIDAAGVSFKIFNAADEDITDSWILLVNYAAGEVNFSCYKPGKYTVKMYVGENEHVIPVTVDYKAIANIGIGVNDNGMETTETTVYTGVDTILNPIVESGCNPANTAEIVGAPAGATIVADGDNWIFNATEAGTYTVKLTSTANAEISAEIVITVQTPPTVVELATGSYQQNPDSWETINLVFTPTDETSGTVTVTCEDWWGSSYTDVFTYTIADGVFTATAVDGNDGYASAVVIENYKVFVTISGYNEEMVKIEASGSDPDAISVTGGTSISEGWGLDNGTATYTTTIAAGESAYFYLSSDASTSYWVDFTVEGDVTAYYFDTYGMEAVLRGGFVLDPSMTYFDFWFVNETGADVTITFTLTFNVM